MKKKIFNSVFIVVFMLLGSLSFNVTSVNANISEGEKECYDTYESDGHLLSVWCGPTKCAQKKGKNWRDSGKCKT